MKYKIDLENLEKEIVQNNITQLARNINLFGGADICVAYEKPNYQEDKFYPSPQFVVTRFAKELSWLIFKLQEIFKEDLNYLNKYSFYGRLAEKANQSIEKDNDNLSKLLHDVIREAREMAKQIN